ncbi:MAG: flagellar motor protein MotB [Candidatus Hydrogenedentes bacterium]|nr:flagellar motor protein MotB [Candidatus Hydrogenedentota bacterium]
MLRTSRRQTATAPGAPLWMVTYSDLVTLLLAFFVLMLSFSAVRPQEFNEAITSVRKAFGAAAPAGLVPQLPLHPGQQTEKARDTARKLRQRMQVLGQEQEVLIEFDATGGIKIALPAALLFDEGSADLRPDALPVLQEIAAILRELPESFIEVRGHTDTTPLIASGVYRDNYDLSYHRAHAVMAELSGAGRVPERQFEIAAAGASQPLTPNDSETGRQSNRRVEVYVRGLVDARRMEELSAGREFMPEPVAAPGEEPPRPDVL